MIKNEAKITNDVEVNINRAAIEHRATWMGLIFDELRKDGIDPDVSYRITCNNGNQRTLRNP